MNNKTITVIAIVIGAIFAYIAYVTKVAKKAPSPVLGQNLTHLEGSASGGQIISSNPIVGAPTPPVQSPELTPTPTPTVGTALGDPTQKTAIGTPSPSTPSGDYKVGEHVLMNGYPFADYTMTITSISTDKFGNWDTGEFYYIKRVKGIDDGSGIPVDADYNSIKGYA
ncbi:MAG: hypothetical protein M1503_11485 [Thaumarchaeota archaeon]|nr:hypothetical protein [Nitrososphaerota archaeon]MCL5318865.1 hypothetical protein [Nitrososphaerota archaeon]